MASSSSFESGPEGNHESGGATGPGGQTRQTKRRLVYGAMLVTGLVFVSTLVLPVAQPIGQLVAVLTFGVMSGLWLAHLVYSL